MRDSRRDIQALFNRMGSGAFDQMVKRTGIPRDTLVAYRNGRCIPSPDRMALLYKAALGMGAEEIIFQTPVRNGVQVTVTSIPELDRSIEWSRSPDWLNSWRPHLTRDKRFHVHAMPDDTVKWLDLADAIVEKPKRIAVAVFPRACWDCAAQSHWTHAILDLELVRKNIYREFIVAMVEDFQGERRLTLCQQIRHVPRSGDAREVRVVPAWPWPTSDEAEACSDFKPWITRLGKIAPLYQGNLRIAQISSQG